MPETPEVIPVVQPEIVEEATVSIDETTIVESVAPKTVVDVVVNPWAAPMDGEFKRYVQNGITYARVEK